MAFGVLLALFSGEGSSLADSGFQGPPAPPALSGASGGAVLPSFGTTLSWENSPGTTQIHLQLNPYNDDGPGVDLYLGSSVSSLELPPPPRWYGLLPDMTYTWRVRASNAPTPAPFDDPSWSPWVQAIFRTPKVTAANVKAVAPASGEVGVGRVPTFRWDGPDEVFYYEVQLSRDPGFDTNPATATSPVYDILIHGGMTDPPNSYTVPFGFALQADTPYHWRVRPHVQGDGTPVPWSLAFRFITGSGPALGPLSFGTSIVSQASCLLGNQQTPPGQAVFSHGIQVLHARFDYSGPGTVSRAWYRDGVRVTDWAPLTLTGSRGCGLAGLTDSLGPLRIGTYRLDIAVNQAVVQSRRVDIR